MLISFIVDRGAPTLRYRIRTASYSSTKGEAILESVHENLVDMSLQCIQIAKCSVCNAWTGKWGVEERYSARHKCIYALPHILSCKVYNLTWISRSTVARSSRGDLVSK